MNNAANGDGTNGTQRASSGDWPTRSFWLGHKHYQPARPLDGSTRADIVILGGGYTGLWSAIHLKEASPGLDVAIVEKNVVGYGASGRNGGFAMTMIARNIHDLMRKVGAEKARATHLAMADSLHELEAFCAAEGIDADVTHPGLLTVSNGPEQDVRIQQDLEAAAKLGLDDFKPVDQAGCRALLATERVRCGHWEDHALLVDPAALARGLKEAALRRGVRVFEETAVTSFPSDREAGSVVVETPTGTLTAERGLIATNAYAHAVPALRKYIFTIYAYIILTERLTPEQWARVGWEKRMGIEDKRIMPHFHRPTADGRILWGGRDAPFKSTGPDARFDRDEHIFARLEETFRWTFPQLDDVRIEHGWAGPVCGTINCFATVGRLDERLHYALGYAGHGVGPSHLVAKIVRDAMLDRKTDLRELPMASTRPARLPPEPMRQFVLNTAQNILQKVDDTGGRTKNPFVRLALRLLQ